MIADTHDEADRHYVVKLNGRENVIVMFSTPEMDEPLTWGFATYREYQSWLKMLARFDERACAERAA